MRPLVAVAILMVLAGCVSPTPTPTPPRGECVEVECMGIWLRAEAWEDWMPTIGPAQHKLSLAFTVGTGDAGWPPESYTLYNLSADDGGRHWETQPERRGGQWVATDGPEWPVGSMVNVTVVLVSEGHAMLLRTTTEIKGAV